MDWNTPIAGLSHADVVAAIGDQALVKVQADSQIIVLAPFVPKEADASDPGNFLASYAPIAVLGWTLFHQDDSVSLNEVPLVDYILSPSAIEAALVVLKDNEFPMAEYASLGQFTKAVLDYKTGNRLQALALRPASLLQLEACTGADLPGDPYTFAHKITVRSMAAPDSLSYAPVSLFELAAAPRIVLASRFANASSLMRVVKAVVALVMKHDAVLAARVQAKERLKDMQDELGELLSAFFAQSSFPSAAISLPVSKYDARDPKRAEIFASMCSWEFESDKRGNVVAKYFINLVKAEPFLAKIVLPAPSCAAAAHNVTLLMPVAAPKAALPLSVSTLSMMNEGIKARNLQAPVDTDEMKLELGETKTLIVVNKTDVMLAPNSTSSNGTLVSGSKEAQLSTETQAWLLSKEAQDIEVRFRTAINRKDVFAAIMVLSRSRNGIFMQLLVNRASIGSSDIWKRAKALRGQLLSAFSFAITSKRRGGSDADTADELIQPDKLDTFTADTAFFDLFWGKDTSTLDRGRGQWQAIHPHKLVYAVKSLQRGSNAATMCNIPADRLWGDFTQNTFVATLLDAAFHFSGYKNGVFTRFIEPVNVILSDNSTLPTHLYKRLQLQLTEAVLLGLKEAGTAYDACFLTNSHVDIFPEDGMELLGPDSKFSRRMRRIEKKLENLSDDEFWEDGNTIDDLRAQVAKGQQRMQGLLPHDTS